MEALHEAPNLPEIATHLCFVVPLSGHATSKLLLHLTKRKPHIGINVKDVACIYRTECKSGHTFHLANVTRYT